MMEPNGAATSLPVSVWLADHTWPEIKALIAAGFDTLLLMLGATEQHGPHLPLATDTIIAEELAARLATRLGKTLVAPIVPVGTSDEHMAFSGTLSLSRATLAGLIEDIGRSAVQHGFQRMLVLSAHGGNYDAIRDGVAGLRERTPGLRVIAQIELTEALQFTSQSANNRVPQSVAGLHAGEYETSELLYLRGDLVRIERAQAGYMGDMRAILSRLREVGLQPVTENGVLGDPTFASAERGELYLSELVERLVQTRLLTEDQRRVGH